MQQLQQRLTNYHNLGLTRNLSLPMGVDLSSNDYLGFAQDTELNQYYIARLQQEFPNGAAGSRLLRGNLELYEQTEAILANFVQREAALLFSSGYTANLALFSALPQENDIVFSDKLNHASIIDGLRLSKAQKIRFPHRDYQQLEQQLKKYQQHASLKIIVTESLFSMEGTLADLPRLAHLAEIYNALLIVDEAHSTGLWGHSLVNSLGLTSKVFATTHTAGKCLGASGAWIAGSQLLRQYLINFARPFIFSTAPIPSMAILLQEAIKYYQLHGSARASIVRQRAVQLRNYLNLANSTEPNDSPIVTIPIGDNQRAIQISALLQQQGWDVRAIRPPTVPVGQAKLRITVKWCNNEEQLQRFAKSLHKILPKIVQ